MTIKAEIAEVQIGPFVIDGLMSENGDFGVAVPQIAERFQFPNKHASRTLKPMLGKDFCFEKWRTKLNPKAVNVVLIEDFKKIVFCLAQKGNEQAIEAWSEIDPKAPKFLRQKRSNAPSRTESKVENVLFELYSDWNPQRQVVTDFGIADIVHDYGVVEIKEYKHISSAHGAIGQAVCYGSILRKQPEVWLYNVPRNKISTLLRMFTAIGMLVYLCPNDKTNDLIKRKKLAGIENNALEIQSQIRANSQI